MWFCITASDHELDFYTACSETSINRSFHPFHPFLAVGPGGTEGWVFLSKAPLNKTQNIYTLARTVALLQKPPSMVVWQWNINPIRRMMQSQQLHHALVGKHHERATFMPIQVLRLSWRVCVRVFEFRWLHLQPGICFRQAPQPSPSESFEILEEELIHMLKKYTTQFWHWPTMFNGIKATVYKDPKKEH